MIGTFKRARRAAAKRRMQASPVVSQAQPEVAEPVTSEPASEPGAPPVHRHQQHGGGHRRR